MQTLGSQRFRSAVMRAREPRRGKGRRFVCRYHKKTKISVLGMKMPLLVLCHSFSQAGCDLLGAGLSAMPAADAWEKKATDTSMKSNGRRRFYTIGEGGG